MLLGMCFWVGVFFGEDEEGVVLLIVLEVLDVIMGVCC